MVHGIVKSVRYRFAANLDPRRTGEAPVAGWVPPRSWRDATPARKMTRPLGREPLVWRATCPCSWSSSQVPSPVASSPASCALRPCSSCHTPYREQRPAVEDGDARRLAGVCGRVAHRRAAPVAPPCHDDAVGVHVRLGLEPGVQR